MSHRNWQSWVKTQNDQGFNTSKLSADGSNFGSPTLTQRDKSPMGFDQMSRTVQGNRAFGDYMNKLEAEEKLKKYTDKVMKGTENFK